MRHLNNKILGPIHHILRMNKIIALYLRIYSMNIKSIYRRRTFVSDLRQLHGFIPRGTPFSSTNKADRHGITAVLLKVVFSTISLTPKLRAILNILFKQI